MSPTLYFAMFVSRVLRAGYGFIISGYNNSTGEDRTNELQTEIITKYKDDVVVMPAKGIWQGVPEDSLVVMFPWIDPDDEVLTSREVVQLARLLTVKYNQMATVIFKGGIFWLYSPDAGEQDQNVRIGNKAEENFNLTQVDGYTAVYLDDDRTKQVMTFTIVDTDSPLKTAESVEQAKAMSATA